MKLTIGPGALVAAAFIGPGTVTACTRAGAEYGFSPLWALVFATLATIILQSMAARLGVVSRLGLGEALMQGARHPALKYLVGGLIIVALGIGNSAYESGNLAGGALGAKALFGTGVPTNLIVLSLAFIAAMALVFGGYKVIEKVLIVLVCIMAIAFAGSALLVRPDLGSLMKGLIPSLPSDGDGLVLIAALIGTTIVPYNLFLHAATVRERWTNSDDESVREAELDTRLSVGLGGLISIFVFSTAAASLFGQNIEINTAGDMALALEPTYGVAAKYLIGLGMLAAGFTSAVTAPMATAYALTEIIGRGDRAGGSNQLTFKLTALAVLLIGTIVAVSGLRPVDIIILAQFANGLLLPVIAISLLFAMNRKDLLGKHVNRLWGNIGGVIVVLIATGIGLRAILKASTSSPLLQSVMSVFT